MKQNESFKSIDVQNKNKSLNSFLGVLNVGTENYHTKALPGIQKQERYFLEINIREARRNKVRPIR